MYSLIIMIIKLLNDILTVKPSTVNRQPSSLNFFNFSKDKLLFINVCLALLLQKFFQNIIKRLLFELPQFNQNFNFARNIYLNVFNKKSRSLV